MLCRTKLVFAKLFSLCIAIVFFGGQSHAQHIYKSNQNPQSIHVTGSSSLHEWELTFNAVNCIAHTTQRKDSIQFDQVKINVDATTIESDNDIMTRKAQDALLVKKHAAITFTSNITQGFKINQHSVSGKIMGTLSIAGHSQEVEIPFQCTFSNTELIKITGHKALKMSDFNISPPTAMLGALKTGNDIEITFDITLNN